MKPFTIDISEEDVKKAVTGLLASEALRDEWHTACWTDRETKKLIREAVKDRVTDVLSKSKWWNAEHIQDVASDCLQRKMISVLAKEFPPRNMHGAEEDAE